MPLRHQSTLSTLLYLLHFATIHAEGLYDASSPVTSFSTAAQLPSLDHTAAFILVEFYAAWCGHCQHFAPVYESIALEAKKSIPRLTVAAVNCAQHEQICSSYGVSSYPTLILWPGKEPWRVSFGQKGPTFDTVINFVRENAAPALLEPILLPPNPPDGHHIASSGGGGGTNSSFRARVTSALKAAAAANMGAMGEDLMKQAAELGISPKEDLVGTAHQYLQPRPMPRPVPVKDVLTAARYSLHHDVANALSGAPREAYARKRLGALRAWLHVLHHALPHDADGGVAATGTGELLEQLHGHTELPTRDEWMSMLEHSGFPDAPDEWLACNSSHVELHAYPCSLWLLFHTLLAHSSEPDALPTLHSIIGYVTNFFGCADCVGHFAVLSARLETDLRELATTGHHHGGRERAALWLWSAHNKVNDRLAAEALADTPTMKYAEFAKTQWPVRGDCKDCRELSMPPGHGVKQELRWRHEGVLRVLLESYCLEPRFECWEQLEKMVGQRQRPPAAEMSGFYGTWLLLLIIGLLLLACGCFWPNGMCESNDAPKHGARKLKMPRDDKHIV